MFIGTRFWSSSCCAPLNLSNMQSFAIMWHTLYASVCSSWPGQFAGLVVCWGFCGSNYDAVPSVPRLVLHWDARDHSHKLKLMASFSRQPRALFNTRCQRPLSHFRSQFYPSFYSQWLLSEEAFIFSICWVMDPTELPGIGLSKSPALLPPKGVESNFVNPYSIGPVLTRLSAIFLALMSLCVLIRFYTKIFIKHSWGWDDCESVSACTMGLIYLQLVGLCIPAVVRSVPLWFVAYRSSSPRLAL